MPPSVALTACIILVVILLWIDRNRTRSLTIATWIPTLWMLYSSTRPVSMWFQAKQQIEEAVNSVEEGNPIERLILSLLIAIGLWVLAKRHINWSHVLKSNRWLLILLLFMLISILWSDYPFISFKRWTKTAGTVIMALVIFSEAVPLQALQAMLRRTIYIIIPFSAMLVKYYPHLGVHFTTWSGETMWVGATLTKNTLGAFCMVAIFSLIFMLLTRKDVSEATTVLYQTPADLLVMGLSLWLLRGPGGSYSATSVAVLILGIGLFMFLRRPVNNPQRVGTVTGVVILGAGLLWVLVNKVLDVSLMGQIAELLGRDSTLTGRTDLIWSKLLPIALQQPLLGLGYGAFWIKPIFEFQINEAHNGYLDVFIELGVVGLILLAIFVISYFNKAKSEFEYNQDWASWRLSFLLIILLHNVTETSFMRSTLLLWNMLVVLMVVHQPRKPVECDKVT